MWGAIKECSASYQTGPGGPKFPGGEEEIGRRKKLAWYEAYGLRQFIESS
jgi:hypothetical protein